MKKLISIIVIATLMTGCATSSKRFFRDMAKGYQKAQDTQRTQHRPKAKTQHVGQTYREGTYCTVREY